MHITFIHCSLLNDPFDPYMHLNTEFGNDYVEVERYLASNYPDIHKIYKKQKGRYKLKRKIEALGGVFSNTVDSTFIFSTSAVTETVHPRHNLYMWGHYGDGHRGIAIEFDAQEMTSIFSEQNLLKSNSLDNTWVKMRYMETAPMLTTSTFVRGSLSDDNERFAKVGLP